MAIAFTFKKSPFYVLLLMAGLALLFFLFHTLTGGRYASLPVKLFGDLRPQDVITVHAFGKEIKIGEEGHTLLKNIRVERGRDSLRLSEDISLTVNGTSYALGAITSPAPLTFIKGPDGHIYLYRGDLLRELGITLQKEDPDEK